MITIDQKAAGNIVVNPIMLKYAETHDMLNAESRIK
jgi:hypothetical protein